MGWYDRRTRRVRDLSCGDARIYLELEVRRVQCRSCGKVKRERRNTERATVSLIAAHVLEKSLHRFLFLGEEPAASGRVSDNLSGQGAPAPVGYLKTHLRRF